VNWWLLPHSLIPRGPPCGHPLLKRYATGQRRALHQAPARQLVVSDCKMLDRAVIPHQRIAHSPLMAIYELWPGALLAQKVQKRFAFLLGQVKNMVGLAFIYEYAFLPSHRMGPHHRMDRF